MRKKLFIFIILFSTLLFSQENTAHQWRFSTNAGVDFSTGIPIAVTNSSLVTGEGCATVGDINGNLLFYTDGQEVYNRNDQLMPNGTNLLGHPSASQSSIIVPYPGSDSLFYIFTVDAIENHLQNGLRYSIVDMSLDGGLGDINSTKNILLENPVSEKITAVIHSNNINVWLIAHKWDSDEFIVYEITQTGINTTPIISALGTIHQGGYSSAPTLNGWTNAIGIMKANMQGTKIALAIHRMDIFELFDFDKSTGILSNNKVSPSNFPDAYGIEFSPDGNYLYATQTISNKLYQFDITQTDPFNNPYLISSGGYEHRGLQIGPNGKIYLSRLYNTYLSAINYPNNEGSNVDFESEAVFLEGKACRTGLPTLFYYKGFKFFTGSELDTSICQGDSIFLENEYQSIANTYYDTVLTSLGWDSIINTHLSILSTPTTPVITENMGVLTSSYTSNNQWYFNGNLIIGATNQQYQPLTDGNYTVAVDNGNGCLSFSDEVYFVYNNINKINKYCINIYPNPTNNILNINLSEQAYLITIIDITGNTIKIITSNKSEYKIDFSDYPNGLYFIDIKTKTYSTIKKVLVK